MFKRFVRVLAVVAAVTLLSTAGYAEERHQSDSDRDDHFSANPEPSAIILLGTAVVGTALFMLRSKKHKT